MIDPQFAQDTVRRALAAGATEAECILSEGEEFSASVRMRSLETLKEAGSRGAGLRVLVGKRSGSSYTSDLSDSGIARMVDSAMAVSAIASEDPFAGLPDAAELGQISQELNLYHDSVAHLETAWKIQQALDAEEAALSADARITNSEGGSFGSHLGTHVFANSLGFAGMYRTASCSLGAVPVAKQNGSMERDYWYSSARTAEALENAGDIGRRAAARVIRRLGARKLSTRKVPVVFEPRTARSLLGSIFEAVSGDSIYRQASFLAGRLGEQVASENVTVIDDATMPGLFGSSPFDDEGVPSRRTVIIDRGVLKNYLLNSYTARKLGMKTTGNASRGITGNAGIGHGNLYLEPGLRTPEDLIRSLDGALYVTELIGSSVNIVNGDYSRGAAGLWIEAGELAYPVSEITIAGNLNDMLKNMTAIASDLEFRASTAAPTLLIGEMTVSGQ